MKTGQKLWRVYRERTLPLFYDDLRGQTSSKLPNCVGCFEKNGSLNRLSAIKKEFPLTEILFLWLGRLLSKID